MDINIDQLTEAELIALNRKIVERLRFLLCGGSIWSRAKTATVWPSSF